MSQLTRNLSSNPYTKDFGNNLVDDFGTIGTPSDAEIHAASLTVCARAEDATEARDLLAMLGLVDTWRKDWP